eukprot:95152_1
MSNKQTIQETLVSAGFNKNYIDRAFKVYEKNYHYFKVDGNNYNIDVIKEIIVRLQQNDNQPKEENEYKKHDDNVQDNQQDNGQDDAQDNVDAQDNDQDN